MLAPVPSTTVGDRIRLARQAIGLTQSQLAQAVGVSRSAVAQWETERAGQVRANLTRVAAALGIGVAALLDPQAGEEVVADNATELALLRLYRACNETDRGLILRFALRLGRTPPVEQT